MDMTEYRHTRRDIVEDDELPLGGWQGEDQR